MTQAWDVIEPSFPHKIERVVSFVLLRMAKKKSMGGFTVSQILKFTQENKLKFQSWLDNLDYSLSACIRDPQNPVRISAETLPVVDQWRIVELMAQSLRLCLWDLRKCPPNRAASPAGSASADDQVEASPK